ncbi:MAG: aspartate-semialdehyde dehydrogenase [Candidatus Aceula meridiana]|nr:aspartate-semialdehyde dehydrogenase [Candidatus Aceula meridiana]
MKKYNVAVVGVGVVGQEMIRTLKQREFPIKELFVFARSDRTISINGNNYSVKTLTKDSFKGVDIALFAGTEGEKGAAVTFAPEAIKQGAVVIDNGADFRLDEDVPLIVPEANAGDIKSHKGIIANPNCSTIQMIVALAPIYKKFGLDRIIASTYQAVSGSGRSGIAQLEEEYRAWAQDSSKDVEKPMGDAIGFNLFPHIGGFQQDGYTSEEWKVVHETHKIFHNSNIKISCTAVRVSVKTGHSEAVYIETSKDCSVDDIKNILSQAPGIKIIDDLEKNLYPMPIDCEGTDDVFVGRIRRDPFVKNGFWLWIVADNLRKGAALNTIQIAEELIRQNA